MYDFIFFIVTPTHNFSQSVRLWSSIINSITLLLILFNSFSEATAGGINLAFIYKEKNISIHIIFIMLLLDENLHNLFFQIRITIVRFPENGKK